MEQVQSDFEDRAEIFNLSFSSKTLSKDEELRDHEGSLVTKQEKTEPDSGAIQPADTVDLVKKQISELLFSKYMKHNQEQSKTERDSAADTNTDKIQSVKQRISNLLQEKYALSQKSSNTLNDEVSQTSRSEKSKHIEEIHLSSEKNQSMDENHESQITDKTIADFSNGLENVINTSLFEAKKIGQAVKEKLISEGGFSEVPVVDEILSGLGNGKHCELHFTECENDEAIVNEIVNSVQTKNIMAIESSEVPSELIGENVSFQEVEGFSNEVSNAETSNVNENEVHPEHEIKCEFKESENRPFRRVSGAATKVTLDLSTISQLTNIWEKSYKNERKQKKTTVPPPTRQQIPVQYIKNVDPDDTVPSIPSISEVSTVTENESVTPPTADIQNLQLSEALKIKLMKRNLEVSQSADRTFSFMKRKAGRPPKLDNIKAKNAYSKLNESEKVYQHSSGNLGFLKRKVGRPPKSNKTRDEIADKTTGKTEQLELSHVNNQEKTKLHIAEQNIEVDQTAIFSVPKRKVGRPKKHKVSSVFQADKTTIMEKNEHFELKPSCTVLSTNEEDKSNLKESQTLLYQETEQLKQQKRKVGRPPKSVNQTYTQTLDKVSKEDQYTIDHFNLNSCYVKVMNISLNWDGLQELGLKIDSTLPRTSSNDTLKFKSLQSFASNKTKKLKPGRPKKVNKGNLKLKFKTSWFANKTLAASREKNSNSVPDGKVKGSFTKTTTQESVKRKPGRPKKVKNELVKLKAEKFHTDEVALGTTEDKPYTVRSQNSVLKDIVTEESEDNAKLQVPGDMWEDDWQSDEVNEDDSGDEYIPSEEENMPNKNNVSDNIFLSKMAKKRPESNLMSENGRDEDTSKGSKKNLLHKKQIRKEMKIEFKRYKRHKHKGPRIGRPPTIQEYKCKHCAFITYEKNLVQKHYDEVHKRQLKQCQYCDFESRSTTVLLEHEGRKHTGNKPFKCDFEGCDYASNCYTDFGRHRSQKHATEKAFKCPKCDFRTKWKRNIRHHDQIVHNDVRAFVCYICNSAFKRAYDLKGHMDRHTDDKPLQCDICGFRCKTNWEIRSHKLTHSDVRPYPCTHPGCKQACKTKSDLSKHMVKHTAARTFKCSMCPRLYKTYTQMKKHEKGPLHITARDYRCDLCGKDFKTKTCLEKHKRIHSGIKPYMCDICQKGHYTKSNLDKHKETHRLDERPFHCPVCPFGAKLPGALLAHIGAMHGDSYAYYCELCRKPFKRYSQLQMHYRRCHTKADQKRLGNAFEVDLALMKMEMELDLQDTFESVGASSQRTGKATQKYDQLEIKEEPLDEEFNTLEQAFEKTSEIPPDIRRVGTVGRVESFGKSEKDIKSPRKRGRPKKVKPLLTTQKKMIENTPESVTEVDNVSTIVASEPEISVDQDQEQGAQFSQGLEMQNQNDQAEISNTGREQNPDINTVNCKTMHLNTSKQQAENSSVKFSTKDNVINEQTSEGGKKSNHTKTKVSEKAGCSSSFLASLMDQSDLNSESLNGKTKNVANLDFESGKQSNSDCSSESVVNNLNSQNHMFEVGKNNDVTVELNTENDAEENGNSSDLHVSNANHTNTNIQAGDENLRSESNDNKKTKVTSQLENKNISSPVIIKKIEGQSSVKLAVFDGFRLPLATKGFNFNYEKRGKKTKSWFMDLSYMDQEARDRQMKYLRRIGKAAKLPRKKRIFKGRRKRKPDLPKNLAEFVKDRKRKMNYYMKKRKLAEGVKLTNEELKELNETLVIERQKRKASFKGNYSQFETLEGEDLSLTEVQDHFSGSAVNDEEVVPTKKQKISNKDRQMKDLKMKRHKKGRKKNQSDCMRKHVLLYSERKRAVKDISIRKPCFIGEAVDPAVERNSEKLESSEQTRQTENQDINYHDSNSSQKRKYTRKKKKTEGKKTGKKQKTKHEPIKPKYKYVKRSHQKKLALERTDLEDSAPGTNKRNQEGSCEKTKTTDDTPQGSTVRKTRVRPYQPGEARKAMKNGVKKQNKLTVKSPAPCRQTKFDTNNQLSFSAAGMLHEAVANSNFVRVHLPENAQSSYSEHISFPNSFSPETGPENVNIRHVVEGGKSLTYCDDVMVMKDSSSYQGVFDLSVNQIKSERFIKPTELGQEHQACNSEMVFNTVHPVLLTQSSNFPAVVTSSDDHFSTDDRRNTAGSNAVERNIGEKLQSETILNERLAANKSNVGLAGENLGRVIIQEASTDREVMQLDYSIVKNEAEGE